MLDMSRLDASSKLIVWRKLTLGSDNQNVGRTAWSDGWGICMVGWHDGRPASRFLISGKKASGQQPRFSKAGLENHPIKAKKLRALRAR